MNKQVKHSSGAAGSRWMYSKRGYALAQCLRQLKRRKLASLLTLLVLGITLALPTVFLFSAGSLQQLGSQSVEQESLTLYLHLTTGDLEGATLAQTLLGRQGIRETQYVSRDEALAMLQEKTDIGSALGALDENPLPGAIIVHPESHWLETSSIKRLATALGDLPEVERVQFDLRWVQRLQAVMSLVRTVGWLLAGFLTLTALLVLGNTIRLELLRRQPELEVSSLLGATNSFLNRPLIYTGALFGFLGGAVACVIALLTLAWVKGPADELSQLYASVFRLEMPTMSHLFTVLIVSTLLGIVGASITLYRPSRHLFQPYRTGM